MWNIKPLIASEQKFIKCKEDLKSLHSGREWSAFDGFVENMLLKCDSNLLRVRPPSKSRLLHEAETNKF